MSRYRRSLVAGGTFFFTVILAGRLSTALLDNIDRLRALYALPDGDAEFSLRWSLIKSGFSRGLAISTCRSASKAVKREKGIWQRRFWEHQIRDDLDLQRHVDYIYFNPVKHGHVARVADWPHSSFHRDVTHGIYPSDWAGGGSDMQGVGE